MKRESSGSTETKRGSSFHPYSVLAVGVVLALILASCAAAIQTQAPTQTLAEPTVTLTATLTATSTEVTPIATEIMDSLSDYQGYVPTLSEIPEQGPITIAKNGPADAKYIYKYAIVTLTTPSDEGENYLNLDDLNDNTPDNSDVAIEHTSGSGGTFYSLYPENGATFYYSDLHSMSYDSCLEHFPFTKMDPFIYDGQNQDFPSGRDYCVLTSEGHLSIIRLDPDSRYLLSKDYQNTYLEVVVTTYSRVVTQALTPYPTETPGPTPAPGRYAGFNLTPKQKAGLDKAAQAFLDAVATGDRKAVAGMMDYPLYYETGNEEYPAYAKDQDEFLSVYGEIFSPDVVKEFKNATLAQNMGLHTNGVISLLVPDCLVVFYADGKISEISKSNVWWNDEPQMYHVTKGDAP
jgi:hypothetical protein